MGDLVIETLNAMISGKHLSHLLKGTNEESYLMQNSTSLRI